MFSTKRAVIAALVVPMAAVAVPASGQTASPPTGVFSTQPAPASIPGCPTGLYTIQDYRSYAGRVFRRGRVRLRALVRERRMLRCQHSETAQRLVRRYHRRFKRERRERRMLLSLTPYVCSFGRSAIPCYIVHCESKGRWWESNPSGAIGFYQFLRKKVPWPVRTRRHKLRHHRVAHQLWAGGAGAHHWRQCL